MKRNHKPGPKTPSKKKKVMQKIPGLISEASREDRARNIATTLIYFESIKKFDTFGGDLISTKELRHVIRDQTGLPELIGEAANGDLRAHGDAFGKHEDKQGHKLNLEVERIKGGRYIRLNKANLDKCKAYLAAKKNKPGNGGFMSLEGFSK